jgi:hypothetical protein
MAYPVKGQCALGRLLIAGHQVLICLTISTTQLRDVSSKNPLFGGLSNVPDLRGDSVGLEAPGKGVRVCLVGGGYGADRAGKTAPVGPSGKRHPHFPDVELSGVKGCRWGIWTQVFR